MKKALEPYEGFKLMVPWVENSGIEGGRMNSPHLSEEAHRNSGKQKNLKKKQKKFKKTKKLKKQKNLKKKINKNFFVKVLLYPP